MTFLKAFMRLSLAVVPLSAMFNLAAINEGNRWWWFAAFNPAALAVWVVGAYQRTKRVQSGA